MKRLYFIQKSLFLFVGLIFLPFSCRKDEALIEKLDPPKIINTDSVEVTINGPTPEFRTRIYIFDEETANQIVSITRTKIILKKGAVLRGARLASVAATEVKTGEIMAAGKTSQTPQGFNRKVTSVKESKNGTEIEIDTEDASFEDIFKNASFTIKKTVEESASLNYTLGRSTGSDGSGAAVELKTAGSASISWGIELPIEVKDYSLKKIEGKIVVGSKVKLGISATGKISTGNLEIPVLKKSFVIVAIIPVGVVPFPVVITPKVEMVQTGEAGLEGSVTFNAIDLDLKGELGAGYENGGKGLYGIATFENSANKSGELVGQLKGYMQTGLKTTLSVSLYDLDYITIGDETNFYARVEGECSTEGKGKADITISGGASSSAFVKFDIFGYKGNKAASESLSFGQLKLKLPMDLCGQDTTKKDSTTKVEPQPSARSTGDPHLTTFDGRRYSFMAIGEFIAAKSTSDNFEVQVRQEEVKSKNSSETVSFNTAIAINTNTDVVSIYAPNKLYVNQVNVLLPNKGSPLLLPGGGSIEHTDGVVTISNSAGDRVKVLLFSNDLDFYIIPTDSRRGRLNGIFGNFDGNTTNDISLSNGKLLGANPTFSELYPNFPNSWRVKRSLFTYENGKNTDSYTNANYPKTPITIASNDRAKAKTICEQQGVTDPILLENCIVDVASTGDNSYAARHLAAQNQANIISEFSIGNFNLPPFPLNVKGNATVADGNVNLINNPNDNGISSIGSDIPLDLSRGFETSFDFSGKIGDFLVLSIREGKGNLSASRNIGLYTGTTATWGFTPADTYDGAILLKESAYSIFDNLVHNIKINVKLTNASKTVLTSIYLDGIMIYQSTGINGSGKSVLEAYNFVGGVRYVSLIAYSNYPAKIWNYRIFNWALKTF